MNDDTLLIVAAAGIGIYVLYKSGVFEGIGDTVKGVGNATSGVGQGIGTIGVEVGESFKSFADLQQSFINRLSDMLNNPGGKSSGKPNSFFIYTGPSGTSQLSIDGKFPVQQPSLLAPGTMSPDTQNILNKINTGQIKLPSLGSSPSPATPTLSIPSTPKVVTFGVKTPRAPARFSLNNIKARRF